MPTRLLSKDITKTFQKLWSGRENEQYRCHGITITWPSVSCLMKFAVNEKSLTVRFSVWSCTIQNSFAIRSYWRFHRYLDDRHNRVAYNTDVKKAMKPWQVYSTCRYLVLFGHGSENSEVDTLILHDARPAFNQHQNILCQAPTRRRFHSPHRQQRPLQG